MARSRKKQAVARLALRARRRAVLLLACVLVVPRQLGLPLALAAAAYFLRYKNLRLDSRSVPFVFPPLRGLPAIVDYLGGASWCF